MSVIGCAACFLQAKRRNVLITILLITLFSFSFKIYAAQTPVKLQYALHCMGCHGANGKGLPPSIPDVTQSFDKLLSTPRGREYLLQVPGVSRSLLSPQDLALILNWMRVQYSPQSSQYPLFTPTEVQKAISKPLTDPVSVRATLMQSATY